MATSPQEEDTFKVLESLPPARDSNKMSNLEKEDMVVATTSAYKGDEKYMTADEKRLAEMGINH